MKRSERITIMVTPEMVTRLNDAMWVRGTHSRSDLVRQYVDEGLVADAKKAAKKATKGE